MQVTNTQARRSMRQFAADQTELYADRDEQEIREIERKAREIRAENARRVAAAS